MLQASTAESLRGGEIERWTRVEFSLRWNSGRSGGDVKNPAWSDVDAALSKMGRRPLFGPWRGWMNLTREDHPHGHAQMQVVVENGNLLVTLFRQLPDNEDEVLSLMNPNWESEGLAGVFYQDRQGRGAIPMVWIYGDAWDVKMVTRDVDLVRSLLREYYETGDVTHPWFD